LAIWSGPFSFSEESPPETSAASVTADPTFISLIHLKFKGKIPQAGGAGYQEKLCHRTIKIAPWRHGVIHPIYASTDTVSIRARWHCALQNPVDLSPVTPYPFEIKMFQPATA